MSEVDRLSNSGLYPALPIADKRGSGGGADGQPRPRPAPAAAPEAPKQEQESTRGKDPNTTIDEYA
jgi:hypothetical protein